MDLIERPLDRELVRRACDVLLKIPGVFSVGLGAKLVNGISTGQLALSIMVTKKKPMAALDPVDVIPAEIEGLPTDVIQGQPPHLLTEGEETDFDPKIVRDVAQYRPIVGGIQISPHFEANEAPSFGTLGGFAKTIGKDPGQRVLVTNHHVLAGKRGLDIPSCTGCTKGGDVGNPTSRSSFATILRGNNENEADAAIAILNENVEFQRDIVKDDDPQQREAIGESRPLETTDVNLLVHKRGMRTRITHGIVGSVSATAKIGSIEKDNQIRIDLPRKVTGPLFINFGANNRIEVPSVDFGAANVQPGDVCFIETNPNEGRYLISHVDGHHLDLVAPTGLMPSSGTHGFFVTPPMFGLKGDSGSLVLDPQRRVVGLLWAADFTTPFGNAWANRIEVVERLLQIKIDFANTIRDTQVALHASVGTAASGRSRKVRLRPAAAAAVDGVPPPVSLRAMVEQDLLALPRGRRIYDLYFTHHLEVRELIDTNRRVATVWHRQGGPGIIQTVLDAVRSRTRAIPTTIRGRSWGERVKAILEVFDTFGSGRLREDIASFGRDIESLSGMTYPGFLEKLRT